MDQYFILLELPKTNKAANDTNNRNFWSAAKSVVENGKAKIISSRADTGICEDFKSYVAQVTGFTTFVIVQALLNPADLINKTMLQSKLASNINIHSNTEIIDSSSQFRILAQS